LLLFRNAAVDADVARAPREYHATWYRFDNATGSATLLGQSYGPETELHAPAAVMNTDSEYLKVELTAASNDYPSWSGPVAAYFQRTNDGWRLIGFERMPDLALMPTTTD
jgi:hypothetical protein